MIDDKVVDELVRLLDLKEADLKTDNELWARCPSPAHEDWTPSWSMNLGTGTHHCFSCGFSGHLVGLLIEAGLSSGKARLKWQQLKSRRFSSLVEEIRYPVTEEMVAPWTMRIAREVIDRVGTWTIPSLYKVGEDPETGRGAFITRDREGRPTGIWVARGRKYVLLGPADAKSRGALFGAHVRPTPRTVVVEGFYQALMVAWWTGMKTVATMGTAITDQQLQELLQLAPLVVMMDGDRAGREARRSLVERIPIGTDVVLCGGYSGDPDDLSGVEVNRIIREAKTRYEFADWMKE